MAVFYIMKSHAVARVVGFFSEAAGFGVIVCQMAFRLRDRKLSNLWGARKITFRCPSIRNGPKLRGYNAKKNLNQEMRDCATRGDCMEIPPVLCLSIWKDNMPTRACKITRSLSLTRSFLLHRYNRPFVSGGEILWNSQPDRLYFVVPVRNTFKCPRYIDVTMN